LDADAAGLEAAVRGHDVIRTSDGDARAVDWRGLVRHQESGAIDLRVAVLPAGHDPDDLIRSEPESWRAIVSSAAPVLDFRLDHAARTRDLGDPRTRSELVNEFIPLLSAVADPIVRAHYLQKLSRLALTDEDEIVGILKSGKRAQIVRGAPPVTRRSAGGDQKEDFLLALLLQFPALRDAGLTVPEEQFWDAQSQALFRLWRNETDSENVKHHAPDELQGYAERLILWKLPVASEERAAQALQDCIEKLNHRRLQAEKQAIAAQIAALQEEIGTHHTNTPEGTAPLRGAEELELLLQRDMEIGRQLHSRGRKEGAMPLQATVDG
jgi:DNA primase